MSILKQLPISQLRSHLNTNLATTPDAGISHTIVATRFRMLSQNKKNQQVQKNDVRLSYQETDKLEKVTNKIKRRISTAGTSKRFPKDFFRAQFRQNLPKKQPALKLKWGKTLTQYNNRIPLQHTNKNYNLSIDLNESDSNLINTPKFHDPQKQLQSQTQNQFLQNHQTKIVSPFPSIHELKIDAIQQKPKHVRPNFIKKVKKGQFLRIKLQTNRTMSQYRQFSIDLPKIHSIQ